MTTTYAQHTHPAGSLERVRVADAMHRGPFTCRPDAPLGTVARTMAAHRIHAVVVAPNGDDGRWGVVSDLDLVTAAGATSAPAVTAAQIASTPGVFVRPDETLARAAQLMRDYKTHHVVVLGRRDDRPVGIVSTLDVADVVAELPQGSVTPNEGRP